jgi:tRNA(Ile)-lysidine synthase
MRGAHPERFVEEQLERSGAIRRGERVLVACSGGPDSVALAAALAAVAGPMELDVAIGHVNHGVRASAFQDECVALAVAARLRVPVSVGALVAQSADEAGLREARYRELRELARRRGAGVIATAHHAGDQSETVLLALFRGTGPRGLGGIAARRRLEPGIDVARPLLRLSDRALEAYCQARALPYAADPTNAESSYRRNAVRTALTALRPLFPGLDEAVARAAELAAEGRAGTARASLRQQVREVLREQEGLEDIDFSHVEAAVRALERGRSGHFHMKAGVTLHIDRGSLTVGKDA